MTLSDLWGVINELQAAGRPTGCVEIIANTIECKLKLHGHKKIKDFDISGILSDIAAANQAFESENGHPSYISPEGEVAWIVCANVASRSGQQREDHSFRPNVVGPVPGTWA
ncbi:MAG: hypothetical protein HY288_17865 [Planctomycetia bacterium]|nr:hypothetical protein [Planctomycetia bacterium]